MSRFDEPVRSRAQPRSALRLCFALVAARPGVTVALTVLTALTLTMAFALLAVEKTVPMALTRAFVASPIVVFAATNASRLQSDALGAGLKALPSVARADLRSKEEAMVGLIQSGLPGSADAKNPLPDAWVVRLRPDVSGSFVTTATSVRDAMLALPGVDQVRFDARWNEQLERWSDDWQRYGRPSLGVGLAGLALVLAAFWLLARDALWNGLEGALELVDEKKRALAVYVVLTIVVASLMATGVSWAAGRYAPPWLADAWKPDATSRGLMDLWPATTTILLACVLAAVIALRQPSRR